MLSSDNEMLTNPKAMSNAAMVGPGEGRDQAVHLIVSDEAVPSLILSCPCDG